MEKILLNIKFSKKGLIRYTSHLDLIRLFSRAVRRANLPVKLSEGFNTRYVFSIKNALKLGIESDNEDVVFTLSQPAQKEMFLHQLQQQLPNGIFLKLE